VMALGGVGRDDPRRIQPLVDAAAKESHHQTLEAYSFSLAACGPAVVPLLETALRAPELSGKARLVYLQAVRLLGPDARSLAPTVAALMDPKDLKSFGNRQIVDEVLQCLVEMGPDTPELPQVAAMVVDEYPGEALKALNSIGKRAKPAVEEVTRLVREHPEYFESGAALVVLGNIGQASPDVIKAVEGAMKIHPLRAKTALLRLGRHDPAMLKSLIGYSESENTGSIDMWIECMRLLGPLAKDAVPRLQEELEQLDELLFCIYCAEAIYAIEPERVPEAIKSLVARASAGDESDQALLLQCLPKFGAKGVGAAEFAASRLTDDKDAQKVNAAVALALVAPERFAEAKGVLSHALDVVDPSYVRFMAARGAARIGKPARQLLEKGSRSPDPEARIISTRALRALDSH
jgi:hypothetical protein